MNQSVDTAKLNEAAAAVTSRKDPNLVDAEIATATLTAGKGVLEAAAAKLAETGGTRNLRADGNPEPNKVVNTLGALNESQLEPPEPEEIEYHVYYSTRKSMRMHTPDGQEIRFDNGRCITDNSVHIAFLENELRRMNPFVYINKDKPTMTTTDLNPMAVLKRRFIQEYLAEQAAKAEANKPRDMGYTEDFTGAGGRTVKVKIPSTQDLGELAGDSNSGQ